MTSFRSIDPVVDQILHSVQANKERQSDSRTALSRLRKIGNRRGSACPKACSQNAGKIAAPTAPKALAAVLGEPREKKYRREDLNLHALAGTGF
jgi:hypothetical protein